MNKAVTNLKPESEVVSDPLALLREPFPAHQVSKLPKPSKKQTEDLKADFKKGARCQVCGGWHQPDVVHLDYVGHAALTDRLLDVDPLWSWEPMGLAPDGTPAFDRTGGLWIKLTVCGVTRLGYGAADGKTGGDAVKEIIGDALRNAAMRFGAALDLWHKGDLHAEEAEPVATAEEMAVNLLKGCGAKEQFAEAWAKNKDGWKNVLDRDAYARVIAVMKACAATFTAEPAPKVEPNAPAPERPPQGPISRAASPQPSADLGIGDDDLPEQFR